MRIFEQKFSVLTHFLRSNGLLVLKYTTTGMLNTPAVEIKKIV